MNIKPGSWHYWLVSQVSPSSWSGPRMPTNLCSYMRRLVIALVLAVVVISLAIAFGGFLITGIVMAVLDIIQKFINIGFPWGLSHNVVMTAALGYVVIVMGSAFGIFYLAMDRYYKRKARLAQERRDRPPEEREPKVVVEPKEPSVIAQWFADKHAKICRHVTYKHATYTHVEPQLSEAAVWDRMEAEVEAAIDDILQEDDPQERTIP